MEQIIEQFSAYLTDVKKMAKNTVISYQRDLKKMSAFLEERGVTDVSDIKEADLQEYIDSLKANGMSPATISRNIASAKALFIYLVKKKIVSENPASALRSPKISKKMPKILSQEEMEQVPALAARVIQGVKDFSTIGPQRAMNYVNAKPKPTAESSENIES